MVASEVKTLASQTAKATHEIDGEIAEIQRATRQAVEVITAIVETTGKVSGIADTTATAVQQQQGRQLSRESEQLHHQIQKFVERLNAA